MTSTSPAITDPRARFWGNLAKGGLLIGGFALFAPVIWLALGGLLGFIAFCVIGVTTWMLKEPAFTFAANMRLKLIKRAAAQNPVESLQSELNRRMGALDERKTAIGRLNGNIQTMADKVAVIGKKYGKSDDAYIKLSSQLVDLKRVADNREEKWKLAYAQLKRFEEEIERASMVWDAAMAAAAAQESSGLTEEDFLAKLKTETSLDTIRTTFNETLASLDTDLMQSDAERASTQAALPAPDSRPAIDISTTKVVTRA